MEIASSSEDISESSIANTVYSSSVDSHEAPEYFEDLPSEDSCLENGTDDDDDDDDDNDPSLSFEKVHGKTSRLELNKEEGLNLGERIHVMRHERGRVIPSSIKEQKRTKALELARSRLEADRKNRKISSSNTHSNYVQNMDESSQSSHSAEDEEEEEDESNTSVKRKKRSKHAPACASSRRSSYFKQMDINKSGLGVQIGANKYKPQDPRFQSLSGYLNQDIFDRRYAFLEEKVDADIERLQKNIATLRQEGKQGKRKRKKLGLESSQLEQEEAELKRLLQEKACRRQANITRAAKQSVKRKIQEDVASGKRGAYYLKRKERKKLEMEARLDELRKVGGEEAVAKALAKRRKKKMSKHSSLMPKIR